MVLKAKLHEMEVAAKTVKPNTERDVLLSLLVEIKIMSCLEEHPNIVAFIGAHTSNLLKGEVYLFVELCPFGSVEGYLRTKKTLLLESNAVPGNEDESKMLKTLINWSWQTAMGMKYLSECKVIHGDLAARNLLLKDLDTLKITDFGLARQLQNYSIYTKTQKQVLPWRHMSPESLQAMQFSVMSDVWSFGVTIWEMLSLGAIPYSGLQWTMSFASNLEAGLRPGKPTLSSSEMCYVMERCWELNPKNRPDFVHLCESLEGILLSSEENVYLTLSS